MSNFEKFAFKKLKEDYPDLIKNGVRKQLHRIDRTDLGNGCKGLDAPVNKFYVGFCPDATRIRVDPAQNPECEPFDITLELWEIEDTSKLTEEKLKKIYWFAQDLYDLTFVFTEVWVCDRYGRHRQRIFHVLDDPLLYE